MVFKALESLKKNPILIVLYVIYVLVVFLFAFTLYPKNTMVNADMIESSMSFLKMLVVSFVIGILGLFFFTGYGKMMSDAVVKGETSAADFIDGFNTYFKRVLVASLLLFAFYIGFSIVLGIIMLPFTIIFSVGNTGDPTAVAAMMGIVSSEVVMVIAIFVLPFVLLWYPAIFIDDTEVIEGMKRGAKASVKNSRFLILSLLAVYIPITIYMAFGFSNVSTMPEGAVFNPGFISVCGVMSIIGLVYITLTFVVYNENKPVVQQSA